MATKQKRQATRVQQAKKAALTRDLDNLMAALRPEDLRPVNFDLARAAVIAGATVDRLEADVKEELAAKTDFGAPKLALLRAAARAALETEHRWEIHVADKKEVRETLALVEEASALRQRFARQAAALSDRVLDGERVAKAMGGRGHKGLLTSLAALGGLIEEKWPEVSKATHLIERSDLERGNALYFELKRLFHAGEVPTESELAFEAEVDARMRIAAVLVRLYADLGRAVGYARSSNDVSTLVPTLFPRPPRVTSPASSGDGGDAEDGADAASDAAAAQGTNAEEPDAEVDEAPRGAVSDAKAAAGAPPSA